MPPAYTSSGRPAKRPYSPSRGDSQQQAIAVVDPTLDSPHSRRHSMQYHPHAHAQSPFASTSSAASPGNGAIDPPKRKITRKRQVLSCRACTMRKIRCNRAAGPGLPCQSCEKRGEGAMCDVGGGGGGGGGGAGSAGNAGNGAYDTRSVSPGSMLPALPPAIMTESPGPFAYSQALPPPPPQALPSPGSILDSDSGCADHRADLERRIAALETALLHQNRDVPVPSIAAAMVPPPPLLQQHHNHQHHQHLSGPSPASAATPPPFTSRFESRKRRRDAIREGLAWPDGPDSETEDAALTLEDIAVNVRIAGTQMQRRAASISTPVLSSSAAATNGAGTPNLLGGIGGDSASNSGSMSREKASLLVPEISKRYRGVLIDLYEALPSRQQMDWLVRHYIDQVSWYWCAHHLPTLAAEYEAFCQLVDEGRKLEIDPLWLAVLFLTLALSANSLDYIPANAPFSQEELVKCVPDYFEAARAALDCGDAFGSARIRTIQAIALLGPLALNSGDQGRVDILIPYVAGALRLCQQLKLDKLGKDDPMRMPPVEDPALPTGVNSLKREVALRLFYALLHLDQVIFRLRPVLPSQTVCSGFPGNFDDKDLRSDAVTAPPPLHIRSYAQYETLRFRVGAIQRRLHEAGLSEDGTYHEMMIRCDAEIRALSAEYELERTDGDSTTPLYWARIAALQNTHIRLIRFHRPFVSRGYRDPAYRGSTEAALASARVVLETQKELDRTNAPLVKDCYQLNHIQVSMVVLFCEIYQQYDPAAYPGGEADFAAQNPDYRLIRDASMCFHRALGSIRERVRAVARQSLLVLQYLFEALHGLQPAAQKEAFGHLLKQISVAVTESERNAALTGTNGIKLEESNVRRTTVQTGADLPNQPPGFGLPPAPAAANGFAMNGSGPPFGDHAAPSLLPGAPTQVQQQQQQHQQPQQGDQVQPTGEAGGEGANAIMFDAQGLAGAGDAAGVGVMGDFAAQPEDVHFGELTFDWGYD